MMMVLVLLSATAQLACAEVKAMPKLDGKWEVTYMEMVAVEQKGGSGLIWEFDGANAKSSSDSDTSVQFTVKRDEKADPSRVDLYRTTGDKCIVLPGIYKFDEEILILCFSTMVTDQPTLFLTGKGDGRFLLKLKRVK